MTAIIYPAVAQPQPAGGYRAAFPDLPGCVATGDDMASLIADARARLGDALKALEAQGEAWPAPTPIEALPRQDGVLILVDIDVDDPPTRVNISIGERLLRRIDQAAQAGGMTRSGFIASAARVALGEPDAKGAGRRNADFEAAARRLQDELAAVGRRLNESLGPDSAFSRNMADLDHRLYDRIQRAADAVSAAMARRKGGEGSAGDEPPRH